MVQQLDSWGELWADLSATAQAAAWKQLAAERGVHADVKYHMTRGLLPEVLYAAGGVERELAQLTAALTDVQRFADQAKAQHPPSSSEEWPLYGRHVSTPSMREASYSFVNLLSWARSTVERTDRPYRLRRAERAGLLPALAPGQLRGSVESALGDLKAALGDYRLLANYALHAGAVPGGGSPRADMLPDGRLLARVPDPIGDAILTWEEFKFAQDRDMLSYATEVMGNIETFVDRVLDAFAAARPARVGPLPSWP
jgi:hypothetical protein